METNRGACRVGLCVHSLWARHNSEWGSPANDTKAQHLGKRLNSVRRFQRDFSVTLFLYCPTIMERSISRLFLHLAGVFVALDWVPAWFENQAGTRC